MALDAESFDILLSTVQRFVRERLVPAENHLEEHDEVPAELVDEMKEMDLFGLTVPEEFGGNGSQGILMDGTPDQKAYYLPRVASGELMNQD